MNLRVVLFVTKVRNRETELSTILSWNTLFLWSKWKLPNINVKYVFIKLLSEAVLRNLNKQSILNQIISSVCDLMFHIINEDLLIEGT